MKKVFLLSLFSLMLVRLNAQKIHTPAEILQLMTDSKLAYEIEILKTPIECKDYSDNLNEYMIYRVKDDPGLRSKTYKIDAYVKPLIDKAENYFKEKDLQNALVYYKNALNADSSLYFIMTYMGQVYASNGDYTNAIAWYKKAINNNFIDYMAHWFLADAYLDTKDIEGAVNEIVIAQILNRNNPRIKASFKNIFQKAKRNTDEWCFNPQVEIKKLDKERIKVAMNEEWTGYALTKSLWKYEPGYADSMGSTNGTYSTVEEKECLISLLMTMQNSKKKINDKQLKVLQIAADNKSLTEYIVYEIMLTQFPQAAYQLPEQTIQDIKEYVLKYRNN